MKYPHASTEEHITENCPKKVFSYCGSKGHIANACTSASASAGVGAAANDEYEVLALSNLVWEVVNGSSSGTDRAWAKRGTNKCHVVVGSECETFWCVV